MTYNEFKMCLILFCKTFKGKKYGEIIESCYDMDVNYIIPITVNYYLKNYLFEFVDETLMIYEKDEINQYFKTTNDFLNYFKIPLEDIV